LDGLTDKLAALCVHRDAKVRQCAVELSAKF